MSCMMGFKNQSADMCLLGLRVLQRLLIRMNHMISIRYQKEIWALFTLLSHATHGSE